MKPHFHKVPIQPRSSYSVRHDILPTFGTIWHYHPEIELHYTVRGEGVRFIGDTIRNFSEGEMLLIGENLPHTWRCKEEYFQANKNLKVEAMVIHFLPDCLGRDFLRLPEAYLILELLEQAKRGLVIKGETRMKIAELMYAATEATNIDRLIILLSILRLLAETDEFETIASSHASFQKDKSEMARLNTIYSYTLANYRKDISLEEIAAIANLSITSFCRYFKSTTQKTYFNFLTEIRISHTCRALVEDKLATEVICFECGFNNVSNFYRHFKKVMKITPMEYKKKYLSRNLV